jgi:hypothetical protein
MKYILVFCILATAALLITHRLDVRYQEGIAEGKRLALNTTNPSHALENACLSLWVGEQNKKAAKGDI